MRKVSQLRSTTFFIFHIQSEFPLKLVSRRLPGAILHATRQRFASGKPADFSSELRVMRPLALQRVAAIISKSRELPTLS